jgi:hypothetical protein
VTIADTHNSQKVRVLQGLSVAEYESLRAEILKLIEMQGQLIALTVVAFGTVLSVGFQAKNPAIVLVHPILALILGVSWMNHAHSVCRCAAYIRAREHLAGDEQYFGWETFVQRTPIPRYYIGFWGVRAIFAISALIAVVASLGVQPPRGPVIALFVLSCLITAVLFWLSLTWKETSSDPADRRTPASPGPPRPPRTETSLLTNSVAGGPSADLRGRETTR